MLTKDTLVDLDGFAVVRSPMIYSDKPEEIVNYYPTNIRSKDLEYNYGKTLPADLSYSGTGVYAIVDGSYYPSPLRIALPQLGQTKCIKQEVIPIPCPKVRKGIETRWRNSRWEKYLKSEGWVTA
jgi:hypothetical protein